MSVTIQSNSRLVTDIQNEPNQILKPISGYEKEPLLSLEQACEPLHDIVTTISQYIWISKENSQNPEDGLTQDESASIHLYTMEWTDSSQSLYAILNRTLREVDRRKLIPWFRYLKLFITALCRLPPMGKKTVWRGVKDDLRLLYQNGKQQAWWAFSSCTTSLEVLQSSMYLGETGTRTLFSIDTAAGRLIQKHSYYKNEEEILLFPGTLFQVSSQLESGGGLHIVHLKEQQSPFGFLLQPPFQAAILSTYFTDSSALTTDNFRPLAQVPSSQLSNIQNSSENSTTLTSTIISSSDMTNSTGKMGLANLPTDRRFKILICGGPCVGKSTLASLWQNGTFDPFKGSTMGADYLTAAREIGRKRVDFQFWDMSGQERFQSQIKFYVRGSHGALIVYDSTNKSTFTNIQSLIDVVKNTGGEKISIYLVATKIDLTSHRRVDEETGSKFAKDNGISFMEVSAKDGTNCDKLLLELERKMMMALEDEPESFRPTDIVNLKQSTKKTNCCARS